MVRILLLLLSVLTAAQETDLLREGSEGLQREAEEIILREVRAERWERREVYQDKKRNEKLNQDRSDRRKKKKLNVKKKKTIRRQLKSSKGNEKKITRESCSSSEVSLVCMKNALEGMMFEKNQIANYLKQAKRLTNHGSISTNKVGKKDSFDGSRKHLLWAIGGNLSDPKCGPNTTAEKQA